MNKIITTVLVIIIIGAAALSGALTQSQNPQKQGEIVATSKCLDFDPPSATDKISFNGASYGLIKNDAQIKEEYKFREMSKIGEVDGKGLYVMASRNYFGQEVFQDIVFLLKNTTLASPYIFDIYIKDGAQIPDIIKNCKSTGGDLTLVVDNPEAFPPPGFNKTEIKNLTDDSVAPAFVYNSNKTTEDFVKALPGVKTLGALFVSSKNKEYSIMIHLGTAYLMDGSDAYEYLPTDNPIDLTKTNKKSLQLKKIIFVSTPSYSWWTPSCKPAIYLYPEKQEKVNVKVSTKGIFTLTIPEYPSEGWNVTANPNGVVDFYGTKYDYLYYESKIPDALVAKPKKGYVVEYKNIPSLFSNILPKLGLNAKEMLQFKEYWEKVLPDSAYYFIGVMDKKDIDAIESLEINPSPKNIIRVRLYFEALADDKKVLAPEIVTPSRNGFTLVEWGGMLKLEKDSTFTCSE